MTNYEIWQAVLAEFELKLTKANFTTWFHHTGIAQFENGHVMICVPSAFTKSWLERKHHSDIVKILEKVTGKPLKRAEYRVENIKNVIEQECFATTAEPATAPQMTGALQPAKAAIINRQNSAKFGLNPKYTFDTFIVGKGNELAHAAAQAVVNRPGDAYNPLFIYGGVGLGKTHLLQAIGHDLLNANPQIKILYVSSERFTNEFVLAMREGRGKEFKDRYRNVDLLLIDDIQFIGGKEQTQEEFFHTFNELHQQSKQVVLTSDRPPKAIPALEDRLRSRFGWGMVVDIAAPDLETRIAILQSKCQEKTFNLEPELVQLIAASVQSNIRELEGVLNKVIAFHQLKNITTTKDSLRSILSTIESQNLKRSATPKDVLTAVSEYYGVSFDDLTGKSREKRLAVPRQIVMFLLREELKMSYPAIGDELGGRDHTTAMHAHTKIGIGAENDLKLKQDMDAIKQKLYVGMG
ncbi:MAG: chromosomal replication initiator protein DnaA [Candidatus Magasanikbacteria bacterium]|nr:chromosomal replication initiator protein DnaA [Candidatus Magasanikbacteria bacterium]